MKRPTVTRLCEHGAPKDTFDRPDNKNNIIDVIEPSNVRQQTRSSRTTTTRVKAQQQQPESPLHRSSRIRNRAVALATTVTNKNDDRQSICTTAERKKKVDTSSSIAEHEETTGRHMDWQNFRIVWRDNKVYRLLIKDSLIIRAHEPWLNRSTHSVPPLVFPEGLEWHLVPDPNGWTRCPSLYRLRRTTRGTKERRRRLMTTTMIITATTE